jgi:sec-independent protein translocase protein TatA
LFGKVTRSEKTGKYRGFRIQHLVLTLVIVILIFGATRLSTVGADLGNAIRGFRKAVNDNEDGG